MSLSVGIVGLPNAGKSTLFKALTKKTVDIANYPFTTINPNIGVVPVSDIRLDKIALAAKSEKITPAFIEFVDIAGIVKGAHKGEGLGNQFLSHIRECDLILQTVNWFDKPSRPITDILKDIEIVKTELIIKDLETVEKLIEKLEKSNEKIDKKTKITALFEKIKDCLSKEILIYCAEFSLEEREIAFKEIKFLTAKPFVFLINVDDDRKINSLYKIKEKLNSDILTANLETEKDIVEFSEKEAKELRDGKKSPLESIVISCYNALELITFFTIAKGKETRAVILKKGSNCLEAAGKIHSDFKEKFIKAEVINWKKLIKIGSWQKARKIGSIKTIGKEYIVQDGDIIEFRI